MKWRGTDSGFNIQDFGGMDMSYSQVIFDRIIQFLDSEDWHYNPDPANGLIRCTLGIRSKMQRTSIIFEVNDHKFQIFFTYPLSAEKADYPEVLDLMNRINFNIMFGCFEMDIRDGEIRFRNNVDCYDRYPSREVIRNCFIRGAMTVDNYGDAFVRVLLGLADAREAYEAAQNSGK